jgi:hypothetical protein
MGAAAAPPGPAMTGDAALLAEFESLGRHVAGRAD